MANEKGTEEIVEIVNVDDSDEEELTDEQWEALGEEENFAEDDMETKSQSVFDGKSDLIRMDSGDLTVDAAIDMDLVSAARKGDERTIRLILKGETDVNETDVFSGETALSAAASVGHLPTLMLLIDEFKANVSEINDNTNWTPLHASAYHLRSKCLKALIDAGADVNAPDSDGKTPLALSLSREDKQRKKGYRRCVQTLRENGGTLSPTVPSSKVIAPTPKVIAPTPKPAVAPAAAGPKPISGKEESDGKKKKKEKKSCVIQ